MPVLGRAIANYLSRLGGLYSVELPESLAAEMEELVLRANQRGPSRALFVSAASPPASLANMSTTWQEILLVHNR